MIYKIFHSVETDKVTWTSISEVGKKIGGKILTWHEYKQTEDKYIKLLSDVLECCDVHKLKVKESGYLDLGDNVYLHDEFQIFDPSKLKNIGGLIGNKDFLYLSRWALRDVCSNYVKFKGGFIKCGGDYDIYIESSEDLSCIVNASGLHYSILEKKQLQELGII